jgi:hypothetical protein
MKVLLAPTNWQTNDNPICNAAYSPSDGIVHHDLLPSVSNITAVAKVFVESIANFLEDFGHASIDLPRQVSPNYHEIVNEIITRSGSKPFEAQDFVLHFGRCDEVLGLLSEPLCVLRWQDDRWPVE